MFQTQDVLSVIHVTEELVASCKTLERLLALNLMVVCLAIIIHLSVLVITLVVAQSLDTFQTLAVPVMKKSKKKGRRDSNFGDQF